MSIEVHNVPNWEVILVPLGTWCWIGWCFWFDSHILLIFLPFSTMHLFWDLASSPLRTSSFPPVGTFSHADVALYLICFHCLVSMSSLILFTVLDRSALVEGAVYYMSHCLGLLYMLMWHCLVPCWLSIIKAGVSTDWDSFKFLFYPILIVSFPGTSTLQHLIPTSVTQYVERTNDDRTYSQRWHC